MSPRAPSTSSSAGRSTGWAEAAGILEAARRYASGERVEDICADFRLRGVPTRKPDRLKHGYAWSGRYLRGLITDETHITGRRAYGDEVVAFPPLYSADLWDAIQRQRTRNHQWGKRNTQHEYLCQHLLYCRECGLRSLSSAKRDRPDGPLRRHYVCGGMQDYPGHFRCRNVRALRADPIEAAVWSRLIDALQRPDDLIEGIRARLDALEASEEAVGLEEAERQLTLLKAEALEIARQRVRGRIDDARLDLLEAENTAQTAYWQERSGAYLRLRSDVDEQRRVFEQALAYIDGLRQQASGRLDALTFAERRALVTALIERIWIDREGRITIEGVLRGDPEGPGGGSGTPEPASPHFQPGTRAVSG
jgi:hypothetical protein